ncbi:MAG TPA: hypothetical protein VMM37_01515, partial [Bacteroidota bacterium]|nr:hypothetical protein [Bacteroidota bacterium]
MGSSRKLAVELFGISVLLLFCVIAAVSGGLEKNRPEGTNKTTTSDDYRTFLINNIFNYYSNNGGGSLNRYSSEMEGYEFPRGSGKETMFEDGLVWGGYHKGRAIAKVGGSTYNHAIQPGPLVTYGTASTDPVAADPADVSYRLYRVRPDINPHVAFASVQTTITTDELAYISRYESVTAQDIYNRYIQDWNQWPASQGAPFTYGKDGNGVQRTSGPYDPDFDIPGKPGADQTLWFVANDMNPALELFLSGSPPIGLEFQRTIWGYRSAGAFGSTI